MATLTTQLPLVVTPQGAVLAQSLGHLQPPRPPLPRHSCMYRLHLLLIKGRSPRLLSSQSLTPPAPVPVNPNSNGAQALGISRRPAIPHIIHLYVANSTPCGVFFCHAYDSFQSRRGSTSTLSDNSQEFEVDKVRSSPIVSAPVVRQPISNQVPTPLFRKSAGFSSLDLFKTGLRPKF